MRNWRGHYYQAGFGFVGPYACGKRQLFIRLYGFGNDRFFRWENVSRRESGDRRGAGNASGRRSRYRRRSGAVPLLSNRGNSFRYGCFGNGSDRNFIFVTLGTLVYTLFEHKVTTLSIESKSACGLVGLGLGMLSSFLGIGGGPINLLVLHYFFPWKEKKRL